MARGGRLFTVIGSLSVKAEHRIALRQSAVSPQSTKFFTQLDQLAMLGDHRRLSSDCRCTCRPSQSLLVAFQEVVGRIEKHKIELYPRVQLLQTFHDIPLRHGES